MLRIVTVPVLMLVLAANAGAADVLSAKLCLAQEYDDAKHDCVAGKALEGKNASVPETSTLTLLSTIKSSADGQIVHVWIADEKKGGKVTVYDVATKTMKDAEQADLDWLKERNIEGARAIVKLPVSASESFRTRSIKTVGLKTAGAWRVQIYDSNKTPLQELTFTVTSTSK